MNPFKKKLVQNTQGYVAYHTLAGYSRERINVDVTVEGRIVMDCEYDTDWRKDVMELLGIRVDEAGVVNLEDIKSHLVYTPNRSGGHYARFLGLVIADIRRDGATVWLHGFRGALRYSDEQDTLIKIVHENFNPDIVAKQTTCERIYARLKTHISPCFYTWDGNETVDLRDKVDLTVDRLTQVAFCDESDNYPEMFCVKYMPTVEFETLDISYAVIRVNGHDCVVESRDGWLVFASTLPDIITNTAQDEVAALLKEFNDYHTVIL